MYGYLVICNSWQYLRFLCLCDLKWILSITVSMQFISAQSTVSTKLLSAIRFSDLVDQKTSVPNTPYYDVFLCFPYVMLGLLGVSRALQGYYPPRDRAWQDKSCPQGLEIAKLCQNQGFQGSMLLKRSGTDLLHHYFLFIFHWPIS